MRVGRVPGTGVGGNYKGEVIRAYTAWGMHRVGGLLECEHVDCKEVPCMFLLGHECAETNVQGDAVQSENIGVSVSPKYKGHISTL